MSAQMVVPQVNGNGYPAVNGKSATVNGKASSEAGGKAFTLRSGDKVPAIGMGTFTGTRLTQKAERTGPGGVMEENIKTWIKIGGRMIDAAQNYLNEAEIGDAIHACIKEGYTVFSPLISLDFGKLPSKNALLSRNEYRDRRITGLLFEKCSAMRSGS